MSEQTTISPDAEMQSLRDFIRAFWHPREAAYGVERFDRMLARLRAAEAQRDALAAAVAKLPTTADGTPIVPGMFLYHPDGFAVALGCVGQAAPIAISTSQGLRTVPIGDCYSTREAADDAALAAALTPTKETP